MFRSVGTIICSVLLSGLTISSGWADLRYSTGATNDGVRYVYVYGSFEPSNDLSEFSDLVTKHKPGFVMFDSSGGSPLKAMELGRLIRSYNLDTFLADIGDCVSACSLAFMGGESRHAVPKGVGVHKSSYHGDKSLDAEAAFSLIQDITAEIIGYMIEMGVDPALLQLALSHESEDMRLLTSAEMKKYRVVTAVPKAFADPPTIAD